jgi:choice-of-anchor A domain-containing protein
MNLQRVKSLGILLALSAPAFAGTALTLGSASGYNVFILGAYATPGGTDIQGSVAVEGTFTATGSLSINEAPGSASPSTAGLIVGGNLSLAGGQLDNGNAGNAYVGGNVSSSSYFNFQKNLSYVGTLYPSNIVEGSKSQINSSAMPIDFGTAATSLQALSNTLANMAGTGTMTMSGPNVTLTATNCTLCVFDIAGGSFSGGALNISAPTGATVVINVSGPSDTMSSASINYTGGATANDTLFNFNTATSFSISGMTLYGSVLAPMATFTGTNGSVDGELVAAAVTGETAEFESGDIFNGNLGNIATPEPSTWLLMATALAGLFLISKRAVKRTVEARITEKAR